MGSGAIPPLCHARLKHTHYRHAQTRTHAKALQVPESERISLSILLQVRPSYIFMWMGKHFPDQMTFYF